LTAEYLARFADDVISGRWQGKQSVWIGPEAPGGDFTPFPAGFDHMRALPIRREPAQTVELPSAAARETASS
jgi:hypothetical protein